MWQFAYPSVKKFVDSGVLIDKTWQRRKTEDSPPVTICAQNKSTSYGWKESGNESLMFTISAFEMFCNMTKDYEERIREKTFTNFIL